MLLIINRQDLMGEHKNSRPLERVAWGTSIIVIGMTLVMLWGIFRGISALMRIVQSQVSKPG